MLPVECHDGARIGVCFQWNAMMVPELRIMLPVERHDGARIKEYASSGTP
jgi:hypothetical protein